MYSGTTFRTKSGRMMGVHQKIDRIARRHLQSRLQEDIYFPSIHDILHFEGLNGPDGIKRKSPAKDEPWHYIDPANNEDREVVHMAEAHINNLATALKAGNRERAAFEAAWLAHTIVDGLTPAHHYPLEAKLEELRGEGIETRTTTKDKLVLPGENRRSQLRNNWEFWGAKGIMTTHLGFELGVATTIAPTRFDTIDASAEIKEAREQGFSTMFEIALQRIAEKNLYDEFSRLGWTRRLARETKSALIPQIVSAVIAAWYLAVEESQKGRP